MNYVLKVFIIYLMSKYHTRICLSVRLIYFTLVYVLRSTCIYYFLPCNYYTRRVCMYVILLNIPLYTLQFPVSCVLFVYLLHYVSILKEHFLCDYTTVKVVSRSQC